MLLTHSDIKEILTWCDERNHCNKEFTPELIQILKDDFATFPKGKGTGAIQRWWQEAVEVVLPEKDITKITRAIFDNTAMEDARLPMALIDKLKKAQGRGY